MFHMEIQALHRIDKVGRDHSGPLNIPVCRNNKTIGTTKRSILEDSSKKSKDV